MTKKVWMITGGLVAGVGLLGLLTGGLYTMNIKGFGPTRDIRLAENLKSHLWLIPTYSDFSIPLVFHSHRERPPYGLLLEIRDKRSQYRYQSIEISEAVAAYKDGEVIRRPDAWARPLPSAGDLVLSERLDGLVPRHADVTITLKGHLLKADGEREAFEVIETFTAQSRSGFAPYWTVMASR